MTDELEREIGRALRGMRPPSAPATLLPRVMNAVRAAEPMTHREGPQHVRPEHVRPWYANRWVAWPSEWKVASTGALLALLTGGWWLVSGIISRPELVRVFKAIEISATALQSLLGFVGAVSALMLVACVALGAGIGHLAFARR